MRILEGPQPLLTNVEVLEHITEVKRTAASENLQTIIVELQAYLRERPAGNVGNPQKIENIAKFVAAIKQENLEFEKAEILEIFNSAPSSLAVLFCLIEEADMRFTEDQLNKVLDLSAEYLGAEPVPGE
ncbi:DNA-directed RNA polymerase III subunit rpc9 [Wickerhamiella sorbophila]|uniref:DNA-directed RNA polymerase III subunit RPC9 n=1 Tax=Wickerhamiella sorbophila TaxID=45607 RepID=A0A2T0FGD9_9ASCO|nr:DNA-directed RNA polymerase III subunit rpc9 [Wickerhamiella sorbophila]PRT54072.1 DNA-directed RNA polymerase III subunit rpc9 [Wickerhamiella sorbophila]